MAKTMIYGLPTKVKINGKEYAIKSDYRAILDIIEALNDPELSEMEKAYVLVSIFYDEELPQELWQDAIRECFKFINLGQADPPTQRVKLMDWKQDFNYIVAPVNRVLGTEIRTAEYLHWWTFIGAYYEIGDCMFAQVVRIRDEKAHGRPLDDIDKRFYAEHRDIVDLKIELTEAEIDLFKQWGA